MKNASDGSVVRMSDYRANEIGKQIGEALSSVTQALSSASDTFLDEWEKMSTRAKKAASVTDDFVNENAWAAAGVALSVGIAAGFFIARAKSRAARDYVDDEQGYSDG